MAVRHRDGNQYNEKNENATCDMVMMMMFELELPYRLRQHGSKAFRNLSPAGWMNRALKRAERRRSLAHVLQSGERSHVVARRPRRRRRSGDVTEESLWIHTATTMTTGRSGRRPSLCRRHCTAAATCTSPCVALRTMTEMTVTNSHVSVY